MNRELKFKNSIRLSVAAAILSTLSTILICALGFLLSLLDKNNKPEYGKIVLLVFACIIASIWVLFLISIIFTRKIIINKDEIKAKRFNKVLWTIKKSDIVNCIYHKAFWLAYLIPVENILEGSLQFKLQSGKISPNSCQLSQKQIKKIKENFDYPFIDNQSNDQS